MSVFSSAQNNEDYDSIIPGYDLIDQENYEAATHQGLIAARTSSSEQAAMASMYVVAAAEISYRTQNPRFADLSELGSGNQPYIDSSLASGFKKNYFFYLIKNKKSFFITAVADKKLQGAYSYYIDEKGILCRSLLPNSPAPTAHADSSGCPVDFREFE